MRNARLVIAAALAALSAAGAQGTYSTVIHQDTPDAYHVSQTLATMTGSRNLGLDPTLHSIFLAGAKFEAPAAGAPAGRRPSMTPGSFVILVVERK